MHLKSLLLSLLLPATGLCKDLGYIRQHPKGDAGCKEKHIEHTYRALGGDSRCIGYSAPEDKDVYIGIGWGDYSKLEVFAYQNCMADSPAYTINRVGKEGGHCVKFADIKCDKPDGLSECLWQSVLLS